MRREEPPRCWTTFTLMLLTPQMTFKVGLFKTRISDHYSIFCITDLGIKIKTTTFMKKMDFNNKNKFIYIKNVRKS